MPTYEYECAVCGRRFERFQKMSEEPLRECPECDGNVRRLVTGGAGFIMKGKSTFTSRAAGKTCCGRSERCDQPPCNDTGYNR
ncbi:MAG: zinc ribbon domain-containing protein [Spirochaetes bacterium]|nr:zinc ribbon domain-containing protein [Spirochaetota bacterium]